MSKRKVSIPTKLDILEYAIEGAKTYRGLWSGEMTEEEEESLDDHILYLEQKILLQRQKQGEL